MQIDGCPWLDGGSIPRLYKLPRLKVLQIGGVLRFSNDSSGTTMLEGLENLTELVELVLVNLPSVQRLPSLSKLRALQRLIVWDIPNLREIEGLEGLKSLKKLQVGAYTSLERLAIADLPSGMEWLTLDLRGCTNFTTDLSTLKLQWSTGKIRWPDRNLFLGFY
ncbi:unnamed protein product [Linum tenue]|uniref:Uncharacterized protein n=1 Tax=Linum tenue TaxID=586396 RepID=A0AAV0Q2D6_9ROSI|nr:unnamed protein product [Linum tenue]